MANYPYTGSTAGSYNTFLPSYEASGYMLVNYSRNVRDFACNRWLQIVKVQKSSFYWMNIDPNTAGRIKMQNLSDFAWPDGSYAPSGVWNNAIFNWNLNDTQRYAYPITLGAKGVAQAEWPILAVELGQMSQLAMTARTLLAAALLFNSANYTQSNTATVATITATNPQLTGTYWNVSATPTNPMIQYSLQYAAQQVQKNTLAAVKRNELILLLSPSVATKMAVSQEVHAYFTSSPFAAAQLRGDVDWLNANWGIPDVLYNFQVVVDDAVYVGQDLGQTPAPAYVLDAISGNDCVMISRPGGLEGTYGTRSFSSVTAFCYEELTVETLYDSINRLYMGRVVDDYGIVLTAGAASYLFQNCVA